MSGQNQKTDKRRAWPIIIMNFTGVYDYEAVSYTHLDVYKRQLWDFAWEW